jgi:hypothetical protein
MANGGGPQGVRTKLATDRMRWAAARSGAATASVAGFALTPFTQSAPVGGNETLSATPGGSRVAAGFGGEMPEA